MVKAEHTPRISQVPEHPENGEAFQVRIEGNKDHPHFNFMVGGGVAAGTVTVKPNGLAGTATDWRHALTPHDKVNVMNRMLATYRQRSNNESGFKVAALGVTESGGLYIAYNGKYNSSRQMRQCAELKLTARAEECETQNAEDLRFVEWYIQGDGPGSDITCPCGDCTNLVNKLSSDSATLNILRGSDGKNLIEIDDHAKDLQELKPDHAWVTTVGHLTRHRKIPLEGDAPIQTKGIAALKRRIRDWGDRPIEEDPNIAIRQRDAKGLTLQGPRTGFVAHAAHRHSKMDVPLDRLNEYMREQIYLTVADRIGEIARERHQWGDLKSLSQTQIDQLVDEEVKWARCAVVQRDDGKLFAAVTIKTKFEPSSENAENNAMNQGRRKKGGVRNVWVMEMHPQCADEGILRTSAPIAVERQLKAASRKTGTVDYHYIPFNEGWLTAQQVAAIIRHRDAHQLYPSTHRGRHGEQATGVAALFEHESGGITR